MTKESRYELQKIDCNCNDCAFMIRDSDKLNEYVVQDKIDQEWLFANKKKRAIEKAKKKMENNKEKGEIALRAANNLKYSYQGGVNLNYGQCIKFDKEVTFQPNTCQIDTQECFVHRKDVDTFA